MRDDVGDYKNVCPLPPICSLKNDGPQKCLPSKMFVLKKCLSLKMIFQKNFVLCLSGPSSSTPAASQTSAPSRDPRKQGGRKMKTAAGFSQG